MSDIFTLDGCYLDNDIVATCGQRGLETAKTLLGTDSVASKITGTSGSYTISDSNKNAVRTALSTIEHSAYANQTTQLNNEAAVNEKNTKRSIQINTYYAKKRVAQNYILKVIYIMVLVVVILWAIQTYTTIIPEWIISSAMAITIGVCSIIIIFRSVDISNRSTFDYDQKITSMKNLPPLDEQDALYKSSDQQQVSGRGAGQHCQDNACCPTFYSFNPSLGYCSFNLFKPN